MSNGNRRLISISQNFPLEILFLRDDDIPEYVADGVADVLDAHQLLLASLRLRVERVGPLGGVGDHRVGLLRRFPDQLVGAGLGLALVKHFVDLHGGTVGMKPVDGGGLEVTCWLPAQAWPASISST